MTRPPNDIAPTRRLTDLLLALVLLTRLPVPRLPDAAFSNAARAVWAYPLVGLVLGVPVCLLGGLADASGLGPAATAGLMLAALVVLTGAMHEDGLADTADGLWGGQDAPRRLEIMKDSRIGAYGVLALILAMGLRWLGLSAAGWPQVISALMLSRATMPVLMMALPHARADGLARSVGAPEAAPVMVGLLLAAAAALMLCGWAGLIALVIAGLVTVAVGTLAQRKIGGQTGDILGACCILSETAVLLTLTA